MIGFGDPRLPAGFWDRVQPCPMSGCWLWAAATTRAGYGRVSIGNNQTEYAHRVAYTQLVGPIANGLQIDHRCRVRCCVNPEHLDPVSQRENIIRGAAFSAENARKTHCPKGHPYTGENLRRINSTSGPARGCNECNRARSRENYAHRRAA